MKIIRYLMLFCVSSFLFVSFPSSSFATSRTEYLKKAKHYAKQANLYLQLSKKYPKKSAYYKARATRFANLARKMYKLADQANDDGNPLGGLISAWKGKNGKKDWKKLLGNAWKLGNKAFNSRKGSSTSSKKSTKPSSPTPRRTFKTTHQSLKRRSNNVIITFKTPTIIGHVNKKEIQYRVRRFYLRHLKFCYRYYLKKNPNLKGRLLLSFVISPNGRIRSTAVLTHSKLNTIRHPKLIRCIRKRIKRWRFSRPKNGQSAKVTYLFFLRTK